MRPVTIAAFAAVLCLPLSAVAGGDALAALPSEASAAAVASAAWASGTRVRGWVTAPVRVAVDQAVTDPIRVRSGGRSVKRVVVLRRRKPGSSWRDVTRATTDRRGRYTVRITAGSKGTWLYRLRIPGSGSYRTRRTGVRKVTAVNTGKLVLVSRSARGVAGNGDSTQPRVSPDGTKVLFASKADNLVPDDRNGTTPDIFVKDLATGGITSVSVTSSGITGNGASGNVVWSPDGTKVLFGSLATDLTSEAPGSGDVFGDTGFYSCEAPVTGPAGIRSGGPVGRWSSPATRQTWFPATATRSPTSC